METLSEAAVLTAPVRTEAAGRTGRRRSAEPIQRRVREDDPAEVDETPGGLRLKRRRTGLRLTFRGGVPSSLWGRAAVGFALLAILGAAFAAVEMAHRMILRDERFLLASGSSILTEGNQHLSRSQVLDVFAGDLERNILRVSLPERKADLEQLPWVKHATVMRLLPDHLKISILERTPVAFVRQGRQIGLIDASGVLLDMDPASSESYSFPVVTGLAAADPPSLRAARMKLFGEFTRDLDATGGKVSGRLSEVDLSNPEDIKALIPDKGADVLVHFGDRDYLDRYRKYEEHLPEWRSQYPKLSSVDMRYERQVVLEMKPGTAVPLAGAASGEETTDHSAAAPSPKAHARPGAVQHAPPVHGAAKGKLASPTNGKPHAAIKADHR